MKNNKKKVVIIDPNNTVEYTYGLMKELSVIMDVIYITKRLSCIGLKNVTLKKWFYSNKCKSHILMGINYIWTYMKIVLFVYFNKIDIVHIQWCKLEKIDPYLIRILKKRTKVIYTAHNVLPHINGESKYKEYKKIYFNVNKIIVHGNSIKNELLDKFKINENKIYIQPYGFSNLEMLVEKENSDILNEIAEKKKKYKKMVLFIGTITKYKGLDRLINLWERDYADSKYLLVIAGGIFEKDNELIKLLNIKIDNTIIKICRLTDYEFAVLCEMANLIVLPYRSASMSGVIYSAARAKTTILTTRVGSLEDYLEKDVDSFVVENDNDSLAYGLKRALQLDNSNLESMGEKLYLNFQSKYNWKSIVQRLVKECYRG